jgi:RNA polymerase sigma-70 factor (ECF subfamily)
MTENTSVVVIGGGYAGVMAANRLTQRADVTVTLINPRASFVERMRLHQLVAGSGDAVVDYRDVLARRIRLARQHVDARRPREVVSPNETRAVLESFQHALESGNLQGLLDMLAPQVVLIADGGGARQAALRPIIGAEKAVRFMVGGLGQAASAGFELSVGPAVVNGNPALVVRVNGQIDGVMAIRVEDARITGLYYVRNPEKLSRLESETALTLH